MNFIKENLYDLTIKYILYYDKNENYKIDEGEILKESNTPIKKSEFIKDDILETRLISKTIYYHNNKEIPFTEYNELYITTNALYLSIILIIVFVSWFFMFPKNIKE